MIKMLASVSCVEEALLVLKENVDIIDLKQPALGALGALSHETVQSIVTAVAKLCPLSATVGDLPMQADLVFNAVQNMAETGVDYIKIGFFPGGDWQAVINRLTALASKQALIAVLFADQHPDFNTLVALKHAGFTGVMLDTMNKKSGSLTHVMAYPTIKQFVDQAKSHQLLCGLAGSLSLEDIPALLKLHPDYLGFRGALCEQHNRTGSINPHAIQYLQAALIRC